MHRVGLKRGELRGTDFGRLLVLVEEDADCYAALGELHTCFTPVVSEFKDFIAAPKFNLYQSLHTAVAAPDGAVTEVLIRTHRMHRVAEAGVVALGNPYATASADGPDTADDGERADPTRPGWLSRLLDWQRSAPDPDTFWTSLRADLAQDGEITVFLPDGGTLALPAGATCVDAAYAQYGTTAHACVGARVNGRLAALGTVLRDGDTVQPLLAEDAGSGPSPDWLEHARTPAARIAIGHWLSTHPTTAGRPPRTPVRPPPSSPAAGPRPTPSSTRRTPVSAWPAAARPYRPTPSPGSPYAAASSPSTAPSARPYGGWRTPAGSP